jgi:hypothetical protein
VTRTMTALALLALAACQQETTIKAENASVAEVMNQVAEKGADAATIKPGKWQVTAQVFDVKTTGMPPEVAKAFEQMKPRGQTAEVCLSEEDVRKPNAKLFAGDAPKDCRFETFEMGDGVMKSVMACTRPEDGSKVRISTDGSYAPEAYKVKTSMVANAAPGSGQSMTISSEVQGKWVGQCDAAAAKKG